MTTFGGLKEITLQCILILGVCFFCCFFGWLINNGKIYVQHILNKEGPTYFNLIIFIN